MIAEGIRTGLALVAQGMAGNWPGFAPWMMNPGFMLERPDIAERGTEQPEILVIHGS
jgi:hypothetical protein